MPIKLRGNQHPGNPDIMKHAIELATANVLSGAGGPFGAVIVRQGEVIATGVNQVTATNDPTAHAEVTAIRNACLKLASFELKGCEIYSSCEPCPMCLAAILWARCDALYFACTAKDAAVAGFDDSYFYTQVAKPYWERTLPTQNLMRSDGLAAFHAWQAFTQKVAY